MYILTIPQVKTNQLDINTYTIGCSLDGRETDGEFPYVVNADVPSPRESFILQDNPGAATSPMVCCGMLLFLRTSLVSKLGGKSGSLSCMGSCNHFPEIDSGRYKQTKFIKNNEAQ